MKKYLLLILLISSLSVFAQYKVSVHCDTTINLRKINGIENDTIYGLGYGGDISEIFVKHQVDPNAKPGISISRVKQNNEPLIYIIIKFDSLSKELDTLTFKKAYYKSEKAGWCPDSIRKITIEVQKARINIPLTKCTQTEETVSDGKEGASMGVCRTSKIVNIVDGNTIELLVFLLLICLTLLIEWWDIKKLRTHCHKLEGRMRGLNEKIQNKENLENVQGLSREDVECMINQKIESLKVVNVQQRASSVSSVTMPKIETPKAAPKIVPPIPPKVSLDTDKVVYNEAENSFSVVEVCEFKLFRIYSEDDKLYYTIVDDAKTREELLNMLPGFGKCIDIVNNGRPQHLRVEPGILHRRGNDYIVDTKLQIFV